MLVYNNYRLTIQAIPDTQLQFSLGAMEEVVGELGGGGGSQEKEVRLLTQVPLEGHTTPTQCSVHDRRFQSWALFGWYALCTIE